MSTKRLRRELQDAQNSKETDIVLNVVGDDLQKWSAVIIGPPDSPFAGGTFYFTLRVPGDYPMLPPTASAKPQTIFHPNIHFETGEVCLDVLKSKWTPAWTLGSVCRAIAALLADPEASSPLNCDAGNLLRERDDCGYWSMANYYAVETSGAPRVAWPGFGSK